eukprot:6428846-Alexandrium_andersonii.AAC.1
MEFRCLFSHACKTCKYDFPEAHAIARASTLFCVSRRHTPDNGLALRGHRPAPPNQWFRRAASSAIGSVQAQAPDCRRQCRMGGR